MKLTILVGPCGAGKSTYCEGMFSDIDNKDSLIRISQDDRGKQHMQDFHDAIQQEKNIVVDRMGFSKEQRSRYIIPARKAGYEIHIVVFHVPRSTCFERIMARKDHPTINGKFTNPLKSDLFDLNEKQRQANSALDTFFTKYERVEDTEADKVTRLGWDNKKDSAIICDLDGTLCNIDHRLHYVKNADKKKRRWDLFNKTIPDDKLNAWCANLINQMNITDFAFSNDIILCSGRVDSSRKDTVEWLEKYNIQYSHLFMRHRSDFRQDAIIKEIILDFEILPRYKVLFCIDDRQQVVDMWRKRGLVCLQCAPGDF